jgi:hypothetical protein
MGLSFLLLIFSKADHIPTPPMSYLLLFGLIIIAAIPVYSLPPSSQDNVRTIQLMQSLNITQPVQVLEAEGGLNIYLDDNFRWVPQYDKKTGFNEFIKDKRVNMIVISDALLTDSRLIADAEWLRFYGEPKKYGFVALSVPNSRRTVLVGPGLIP